MASRSKAGSSDPEACPARSPTALSLVEVGCALCGAEGGDVEAEGWDFEYHTVPNEFRFLRCRSCRHLYLSPRPLGDDLGLIYPSDYYAFSSDSSSLVGRLRRRWEGAKVGLYRQLVGEGPQRILDVGCGDGRFLGLLRDFGPAQWQLVGVDFDPAVVEECRAQGFEAYAARMEEFREGEGCYDAVVMLQLIEHVEDPVEICRRVHGLLRPGGLFIVETPNVAGLDYRIFRGRWWGHYHFPRHWNLFTNASLRRMFEDQGFEVARSEYLISTSSWIHSFHNWLLDRGWPGPVHRFFHYKNPLLLGIFVLFDWLRARLGGETSNQRVIARKL